ncbi:MAG: hypothetical protein AAF511_08285 [Pseudomonadota bacterium]
MTSTVAVTTYFDAPADEIWQKATATSTLHVVAAPMVTFQPVDPPSLPVRWEDGDYLCALRLFGFLPIGQQVIGISYPPPEGETRFLRDNGHSQSIKRWDHWVSVTPEGEGTRYEDRLEIDAGWQTPIVAAFAKAFYTHRQARLRKLAAGGFGNKEAA